MPMSAVIASSFIFLFWCLLYGMYAISRDIWKVTNVIRKNKKARRSRNR